MFLFFIFFFVKGICIWYGFVYTLLHTPIKKKVIKKIKNTKKYYLLKTFKQKLIILTIKK